MRLEMLKRKTAPNKTNFFLDIIILIGFLFIMEPELTGIAIHEWFSLLLGAVMAIHIIRHWKWVIAIMKEFFRKLFHLSRLKFILSLILLVTFIIIFWSGLMESVVILRFFGLRASRNPIWEEVHSISTNLMWFIVGFHILLDWKWFLNAFKRYLIAPLQIGHWRKSQK